MYDIAVVGAGASGIVAAITAKRAYSKLSVLLIDALPKIGKKILATGNGRCNITNLKADGKSYNTKAVSSVIQTVSPEKVIEFFSSIGLECIADNESRIYPMSNTAASVLDCLRFEIERLGIEVLNDTKVTSVNKRNDCFVINDNIECRKVIVTTGGKALKFYSSMRLDVRRVETIKQGDQMIGNRTRVKIVKNKVAPPFKQAEFDIMYGEGISKVGDIMDSAVEAKLLDKAGSWYSYKGERIGQGRENIKNYLKEHPEVVDELEGKLLDLMKTDGEAQEEPLVSDEDFSEIMDMIIDEDGVVIE